MIDVRNDGHVANVMLLVHQLTQLIDGKLHHGYRSALGGDFRTSLRPEGKRAARSGESEREKGPPAEFVRLM
jgi:hypothetical protein